MDINDIENFGGIEADEDDLLRECFHSHPAYIRAKDRKAFLILGRKGSGKTAIYKKLIEDHGPDRFSFGHVFDDYPWVHHDLQAQNGVPEERRYVNSWRYLILLTLSKLLLNRDESQPWSDGARDSLAMLEAFVVDSYGSRDPDVHQFFSPEKELRFKGKFGPIQSERVRVRELPKHVQEINASVEAHVLNALNPAFEYIICFDQLDLGFSVDDPKYSQRVIGLLLAAWHIFKRGRAAGKKLAVIIFLRDDIYELLHFEDKNKITEHFMARVEWDTGRDEALSLKSLMELRFSRLLGGDGTRFLWPSVFDDDKQMPSRQSKYQHICDRTFRRPRDMIKFCNETLSAHRRLGTTGSRFVNGDLIAARPSYSAYLLSELDDEIAKHVPDYQRHLEVVQTIGREIFEREQFSETWAKRPYLADQDPNDALQRLFDFSVLGYLKTGGGGGGSKWVWRYIDPSPTRAILPADATTLRVHPGFKEALELVKGQAPTVNEWQLSFKSILSKKIDAISSAAMITWSIGDDVEPIADGDTDTDG